MIILGIIKTLNQYFFFCNNISIHNIEAVVDSVEAVLKLLPILYYTQYSYYHTQHRR